MDGQVRFVSQRLRSSDDEARAPKYAHVERERRWLVDPAKSRQIVATHPIAVIDHYIIGTRIRLRRMTSQGLAPAWKLTRKYECADPLARPIVTAYLTEEEFAVFAGLPAHKIQKQRFLVSDGGREFSLDRFEGTLFGLELAEIEMVDDNDLRNLLDPSWALREVSHDPRYEGGTLCLTGVPRE